MTKRFALKIAYDGEQYHGFQRQRNDIKTIEGEILSTLTGLGIISEEKKARYSAAGRTDAGVSAIGQVIAFDSLREKIYLEEINQNLPYDIYAWGISKVDESFNARRNATSRTYYYFIPYYDENIKLMKQGMKKLTGTHDFKKLSKKSDLLPSGKEKSTVLTLDVAEIKLLKPHNLLRFIFTSQSFLWKQVRKMTSVILAIGKKELSTDKIADILNPDSPVPKGGIKPMPPDGLVLYEVTYDGVTFDLLSKKRILKARLTEQINAKASKLEILDIIRKKIV